MSRSLDRLEPEFREKLELAITKAKDAGYFMVPYETERHVSRQAALWRQSRPTSVIRSRIQSLRNNGAEFIADAIQNAGPQSGPWATNAIPGLSWHQWGLACDLYWDSNGTAPGGVEWSKMEGYREFAKIARDIGLTSGFFWRSRDAVHVQLPTETRPPYTIAEISAKMQERFGD